LLGSNLGLPLLELTDVALVPLLEARMEIMAAGYAMNPSKDDPQESDYFRALAAMETHLDRLPELPALAAASVMAAVSRAGPAFRAIAAVTQGPAAIAELYDKCLLLAQIRSGGPADGDLLVKFALAEKLTF
jgi:hypothetical protein